MAGLEVKKIICPVCCDDECCVSENDTNNGIISYTCFKCGMSSTSEFTLDKIQNIISVLYPGVTSKFKILDDNTNTYWVPIPFTYNFKKDDEIISVSVIPVESMEEGYSWSILKIDTENVNKSVEIASFKRNEFAQACNYLGLKIDPEYINNMVK